MRALVLLLLAASPLLAQGRTPDLAGTWTLNEAKSRSTQPLPAGRKVIIERAPNGYVFHEIDGTDSTTVLFSLTGSNLAGWLFAAMLGLIFTLGMIATDTLNGLWVSRMVRSADRGAAASRVMSLAIGFTSLAIAALAVARRLVPSLDARAESWGIAVSVGVVAAVAGSYLLAARLAAREREASWNA